MFQHAYVCVYCTSSRPTATDSATPVERRGRLPWGTGHGSLWSSPSKSVKFISTLCTGWRNLVMNTNTPQSRKADCVLFFFNIWKQLPLAVKQGSVNAPPHLQEAAASWGASGRPCCPDAAAFVKPSISWNAQKGKKNHYGWLSYGYRLMSSCVLFFWWLGRTVSLSTPAFSGWGGRPLSHVLFLSFPVVLPPPTWICLEERSLVPLNT